MKLSPTVPQSNSRSFLLVLLGMLAAFGPFVTDLYLPALPQLASYFLTHPSMVQLSLTMGMAGLGLGQLIIGPLSDKYGRRPPLVVAMVLFVVATALCIISPNIMLFNLMRLLQGMAASGGIVISRSISADLYTGNDLTRFLSMIAAVNGIAPVLAPVVGGVLVGVSSWQGAFWLLLLLGLLLLGLTLRLRESLAEEARTKGPVWHTFGAYLKIFRNRKYDLLLSVYMFSMFMFFAYISSSPFIFQEGYGLGPMGFGLCFALNAAGIAVGCSVAGRMQEHHALKLGAAVMVVAAVCCLFALWTHASVFLLEPSFMLLVFAFGLTQPPVTSLVLDAERDNVGAASAALGGSGFLMGAVVSPIVGMGNIFHTTAVVLLLAAVVTALLIVVACRRFGE